MREFTCRNSSYIAHFQYDESQSNLFVTFVDGDEYCYFGVTSEIYSILEGINNALGSIGEYFVKNIKNIYRSKKIQY